MDIKDSYISFDKENKMYKIDLGFYTRYFDSFTFCNNGLNKFYGENLFVTNDFWCDDNYLFGFSLFAGKVIFNIFNISNFENIYRIVNDMKLSSFQFKGINYYILFYSDLEGKTGYYTNFLDSNFDIKPGTTKLTIKNKILDSILFEEKLNFKNVDIETEKCNTKNEILIDAVDFYYFNNLFELNENSELVNDLKNFDGLELDSGNNKIILSVKEFVDIESPTIIFSIRTSNLYFDIHEIKKLFLTINPNQYLIYSIDNVKFKEKLSEFTDIEKTDITKLDLDFQMPTNIYEYDPKFKEFQTNLSILRYSLYNLNYNLEILNNNNIELDNPFVKMASKRLELNKITLENNIKIYQTKLNELINLISTYIKIKK